MKNKVFNILSLFSGGGFLDLGFINQGFQVVEAVELEPNFIKAYNFGMESYFNNSENYYVRNKLVCHFNISRPIDASCGKEQSCLKDKYFGITGIIGGPPCQDYSIGGKNGGIEGERGKLINSYFKILKEVKPDFLFFENVEGLYKTGKHRKAFDSFVKDIENSGYFVWHDILNVLEYGHPQDRPRVALVAFRKEIIEALVGAGYKLEKNNQLLKYDDSDKFVFRWPIPKYKNPKSKMWPKKWKFGNNISDYPLNGHEELCIYSIIKDLNESFPNQKEHFKPRSKRFNEVDEGDTNRKSFKRLHRYRYSPTVAYGNNEVHLHPTEARRLTVREGLRIQTVPDEYILPSEMPLTPKFKLISNGVPTAKAELVAKEIRRTLINYLALQ
ncbi:MAG: DNA cytosine methyltransferase [Bacteroidota bacterium]|nr:DNA cytosine methyltransferase [Bacteroidota bacterium]